MFHSRLPQTEHAWSPCPLSLSMNQLRIFPRSSSESGRSAELTAGGRSELAADFEPSPMGSSLEPGAIGRRTGGCQVSHIRRQEGDDPGLDSRDVARLSG